MAESSQKYKTHQPVLLAVGVSLEIIIAV